jgi:hypothetical protein
MADKRGLGFFGFLFAVVTAAVMLVAVVTVQAQISVGAASNGAHTRVTAAPAAQAR